jgi:hypothetical protein
MRPFSPGSDYVDQIGLETDEGSERIKAAYGANYERLVAVKNKYDPTNLFRHNQNIKPTVSANPAGAEAPEYAWFRCVGGSNSNRSRVGAIQIDSKPRPRIPSA